MARNRNPTPPLYLGIEGGGTHTQVMLADEDGRVVREFATDPANLRLLTDAALRTLLRKIRARIGIPAALGIGLAGARQESDRIRIREAAAAVWRNTPCRAGNDLETALRADGPMPETGARVLVLSGTGSCCFGGNSRGGTARTGGWGHVLGDRGSAYAIGLQALRALLARFDRTQRWPVLGRHILRALQMNAPDDLIDWARGADKAEIAALAVAVFHAARERDATAREVLWEAANELAEDALSCARTLARPGTPVDFVLSGGTLLKQPGFARQVGQGIRRSWPSARVRPLGRPSVWGAVALAREAAGAASIAMGSPGGASASRPAGPDASLISMATSPTEQRHPDSRHLDRLSTADAVGLFLREDATIPRAILAEKSKLIWTVNRIAACFKAGGRLFYAGAGTSGRLGVLDASECPPTFCTPPEQVQGIIAGGRAALWSAVEGAEDDWEAGAAAARYRGIGRRDLVVGIAASGRTPFVLGVLREARRRGAGTVLVCFNPHLKLPPAERPDRILSPDLGPELLTGSTRLKCGTATKLILNIFTTLAMVRTGKVMGNLMVDLHPSNVKLRDRAERIVRELTGVSGAPVRAALEASGWDVRSACARLSGTGRPAVSGSNT